MKPYLLQPQTYTTTPGKIERERDVPLDSLISENRQMIFFLLIVAQKHNSNYFTLRKRASALFVAKIFLLTLFEIFYENLSLPF